MKPVISCLVLLMMFILVVSCGNEEEEIIDHDIEWKDYINGTWGNVKVTKNIHMQGKTTSQEVSNTKKSISFTKSESDIFSQNFPLNATYEVSIVGKTIYFRSMTAEEFIFQDSEFSPSKLVFKQYHVNPYGNYIEETVYMITK